MFSSSEGEMWATEEDKEGNQNWGKKLPKHKSTHIHKNIYEMNVSTIHVKKTPEEILKFSSKEYNFQKNLAEIYSTCSEIKKYKNCFDNLIISITVD